MANRLLLCHQRKLLKLSVFRYFCSTYLAVHSGWSPTTGQAFSLSNNKCIQFLAILTSHRTLYRMIHARPQQVFVSCHSDRELSGHPRDTLSGFLQCLPTGFALPLSSSSVLSRFLLTSLFLATGSASTSTEEHSDLD